METKKLNNGVEVLAKSGKYGLAAVTYANRTQAAKMAEKIGGSIARFGRVFYVKPAEPEAPTSYELMRGLSGF